MPSDIFWQKSINFFQTELIWTLNSHARHVLASFGCSLCCFHLPPSSAHCSFFLSTQSSVHGDTGRWPRLETMKKSTATTPKGSATPSLLWFVFFLLYSFSNSILVMAVLSIHHLLSLSLSLSLSVRACVCVCVCVQMSAHVHKLHEQVSDINSRGRMS